MPQYGRTIQDMVNYCLTITDREERTVCAHSIINAMARILPKVREEEDYKQKLWDHLAIMADFKLDIDWPVTPATPEKFAGRPEHVSYGHNFIRQRVYGKEIEKMVEHALTMDNGPERDELVFLIANHLKKTLLANNKDGVRDERVFKDLAEMSHGMIDLTHADIRLHDFKIVAPPTTGKKKKKK